MWVFGNTYDFGGRGSEKINFFYVHIISLVQRWFDFQIGENNSPDMYLSLWPVQVKILLRWGNLGNNYFIPELPGKST